MATIVKQRQRQNTKGSGSRKPYTVRYWADGKQREKSFATQREARDFLVKTEHDIRAQVFTDPKLGNERFRDAAERWISLHTGAESTKAAYRRILLHHVNPVIGDRSLRSVAADRDGVRALLLVTLPAKPLKPNYIRMAYLVIRATVNDAVKAGKLPSSRLDKITLPAAGDKADFIFPAHGELEKMAAGLPAGYQLTVWLMRGCGLRISEALAVSKGDFINGKLRIHEQLSRDGKGYGPLKHRKPGAYRDIPVPAYVAGKVSQAVPGTDGHLFKPVWHKTYSRWFNDARDKAGIPAGFTPHSLRHVFASVALRNGIPITDLAAWLGHANIQTTYGEYGHLVPDSWDKARAVLDQEYNSWRDS
jgi:integrase